MIHMLLYSLLTVSLQNVYTQGGTKLNVGSELQFVQPTKVIGFTLKCF